MGKSTRPQAPMNRVSPEMSCCCTRKHCEPGVWPGVCTSVIWTSPPSSITWLFSVGTLEDVGIRSCRICVSVLCTYTGTSTSSSELDHAWNVVAKEFAAGVVLMRMGDEHLADRVAVLLGRLDDALNVPGWIDDRRLACGRIANEMTHNSALARIPSASGRVSLPSSRSPTAYRQQYPTIALYVTHYTVFLLPCLPRTHRQGLEPLDAAALALLVLPFARVSLIVCPHWRTMFVEVLRLNPPVAEGDIWLRRHDIVIIGGGAAGFTAGMYAARDRCRALLLGTYGGRWTGAQLRAHRKLPRIS